MKRKEIYISANLWTQMLGLNVQNLSQLIHKKCIDISRPTEVIFSCPELSDNNKLKKAGIRATISGRGRIHAYKDLPSIITYIKDDVILSAWHMFGKLHRLTGPAIIISGKKWHKWYIRDICVKNESQYLDELNKNEHEDVLALILVKGNNFMDVKHYEHL